MDFPKEYQVKNSKANQLLQLSYAASVAFTQAIATFASVRAEQEVLSNMTDKQLKALTPAAHHRSIGFAPAAEATTDG